MHTLPTILRAATAIAVSAALVACGGSGAETSAEGHAHEDGEEHSHEEGEEHDDDDHGHVHVAPNGGTLVEIGDHFANVEFVLDAESGELTMYTLGAHAETAVRCPDASVVVEADMHGDAPTVVTLAAQESSLSGETVGDSSKFVGQHDELKGADHFHGLLKSVSLMDTTFTDVTFDFPGEQGHEDGEDHDHDH